MIVPPGLDLPGTVSELQFPRFRRIVIANPAHAPYGLAAEQALQTAGILSLIKDRLIFGENVADTMRIVASGNADVGIVALSLAIAAGVNYTSIPADLHTSLEQTLVITAKGSRMPAVSDFATFLQSGISHTVLARYGFGIPRTTRMIDRGVSDD